MFIIKCFHNDEFIGPVNYVALMGYYVALTADTPHTHDCLFIGTAIDETMKKMPANLKDGISYRVIQHQPSK